MSDYIQDNTLGVLFLGVLYEEEEGREGVLVISLMYELFKLPKLSSKLLYFDGVFIVK